MKKLAVYATLAVLAHAAMVLWHLFVLAEIPPGLTGQQLLLATITLNVVPFVGSVLLWTHYPRLASVLIGQCPHHRPTHGHQRHSGDRADHRKGHGHGGGPARTDGEFRGPRCSRG